MHGLMIAIEYSYKLDRKNYFNLWCKLGRLLLRQSRLTSTNSVVPIGPWQCIFSETEQPLCI